MKALIDIRIPVAHITSWTTSPLDETTKVPVMELYPNSARVCQIEEKEFEVHENLIWVECGSDIQPSTHYYNKETGTFHTVTNVEQ